jgi:hypothetical protein
VRSELPEQPRAQNRGEHGEHRGQQHRELHRGGSQAKLYLSTSLAVNASGVLYVADWGIGCLRHIEPSNQVSLVADNPHTLGYANRPAATSLLGRSVGLTVLPSGALLYVVDSNSRRIRQFTRQ